jgi:hypothetical protein
MSTKTKVDALWEQFRTAINKAYAEADKSHDEYGTCLRDYAENISWSDDLAGLLGRETANERQHRNNRPSVPGFSTETAAKVLIMSAANRGSKMTTRLPDSQAHSRGMGRAVSMPLIMPN